MRKIQGHVEKIQHHGLPEWPQLQIFYNGLGSSTETLVDAATGGSIVAKTHEVAYELPEEMAANAYQWLTNHSALNRAFGVHEVDPIIAPSAQVANLSKQIGSLIVNAIHTLVEVCDSCNGEHTSIDYNMGNSLTISQLEQAQFIGNYNR